MHEKRSNRQAHVCPGRSRERYGTLGSHRAKSIRGFHLKADWDMFLSNVRSD